MKKKWGIIIGAVCAALVLLVGILSLANGYFILAPGLQLHMNGEAAQEIAAFSEYQDPGATARRGRQDLTDQLTVDGTVNTEVPGEYVLTYRIEWKGKERTARRTVQVTDQEAPQLKLEGESAMTVSARKLYEEPGFTALDRCDGDLTEKVQIEEVFENDVLTLTYTVADKAGNEAKLQRVVTVKDIVPPELTLYGGTEYMLAGTSYREPGYSAEDDVDGDLTDSVQISGRPGSSVGTCHVTYTVTDAAGNTATAQREVVVYSGVGNPNDKVYLTFDDGPSSDVTVQVLDTLKANGVKATFFILNYSDSNRYLVQRMIDEGHTIGIHGYSHDYATIYANDEAFMSNVYDLENRLIRDFGYHTKIVRFPGGSSNTVSAYYNEGIMTRLAQRLEAEGYTYFDWNVSSGDASGYTLSSADIYYNVTNSLYPGRGNVVLMHDTSAKATTAGALQDIIDYARGNGYTLLPITDETEPVHHGIAN